MAQATGAQQMMIHQAEETRLAFAALAKQPAEASRKELLAGLASPYPYAQFLAAKTLADLGDKTAVPALLKRLEAAGNGDTVGFWWCCEALGRLGAKEAIPLLAKHATSTNPPGTYGPEGMARGYVSAWTLAKLAGDVQHAEVQRLLKSENVWLRGGALRGWADAKAAGVDELLKAAAAPDQPALVRQEARLHLR